MKNKILCSLIFSILISFAFAQQNEAKTDDISRIIINVHLPVFENLSEESRNALLNKLNQITTENGIGGNEINPRFLLTANIVMASKEIIPGPPQMISQILDITFYVGDAIENKIFASLTIKTKGVGTNEIKANINAINSIKTTSSEVKSFIEKSKNRIVAYYKENCSFILKQAETLKSQGKYDEAIYQLSIVPAICKECYNKSLDSTKIIYKEKIEKECDNKLNEAKVIWLSNQSENSATKVSSILQTVNPSTNCISDVLKLINDISIKLNEDEKKRLDFKMKEYNDSLETEKDKLKFEKESLRIYKDIAIEYAKHQPMVINYNYIRWR